MNTRTWWRWVSINPSLYCTFNAIEHRLGICRDRRDRWSCKSFVGCVNFLTNIMSDDRPSRRSRQIPSLWGRCWYNSRLCSNLLATNHLYKVVRHQNALDFHLLMILANICLKSMGKVEDREKRKKILDLPEKSIAPWLETLPLHLFEDLRVVRGDKGNQDTRNYQTNDHFPEKRIKIKCWQRLNSIWT